MKTFKKVLALLLVVALTATAAVSMTLAYLQDDDEAVNTMTLGNVYIDQIEQERGESGLEDFQQDKPLYPAIGELTMTDGYWTNNNVVDKIVTVTNTGASEAYVRTVYAFEVNGEDDFEALLHINWADGVVPTRIGVATIDDSQYVLYEHIYGVMQPGDSAVTLKQVALDWSATNEDVEPLGSEYKILVVSQAIQTNGFDDAETALNAGFGDITTSSHPWVNGIIGDRWDGTSDPDALEDNTNKDTKTVEIYNAEQLKAFADSVNGTGATTFSLRAAATGNSYAGYTVKLMANIDLNNVEWTPIGSCDGTTYFQGTFDGQGYTISNLKVDRSTDTYGNSSAGLFGWVDQAGATIKNVKIDKATVKGSHWVGAVVGYMTGTISDCTVTNSTITGFNVNDDANGDKVGGIVGMVNEHSYINNNTVADCTISGNRDIGGIAGAVTLSTKEMNNNKVKDTVITYTTARSDYASAGEIVSGRTGYVANDTNTVADVIVGQVGDNGLIADANNARTYLITSADDLVAFNSYVATGVAGEGKAVTAKLLADIDMAGKTWPAMNGHWVNFDGQGHTISNLTPTANNVGKNGFVGYLGAGNISNLTLKNVNVVGAQAGIFAGQNEGGSITNCKIEGTNTVVWKQNTTGSYVEEWGGIGAVIGVNNRNANINAEIKSGAVVTLNKTDLVTQCAAIDNYVGYLNAYTGAVTNNGTVKVIKETEATDNASLDQAI